MPIFSGSTDGRIENLELLVLDDDRKFFLPYSGAAVVRSAILDRYPQLRPLLGVLSEHLTEDLMRDLNGRIDIDGEDPADVAYDWLRGEGLVE